jgi:hypothetical protein
MPNADEHKLRLPRDNALKPGACETKKLRPSL